MIPRRIAMLLLLLSATAVQAQIPKMERGEAHERLDFLVGRFIIESRMYMGDEVHHGRHPATIEWLPGGVWLEERIDMPETPIGPLFGSARTAWDEGAGEYVRHWIDNQSHVVLTMRGKPTDDRTLEFAGSFTWIDGTVFHQRLVVRRLEDGGWSQTGYMGRDPDELRLNHEDRATPIEAERASAAGPPGWFREHMEYVTRDGGRWIADNAAYRSENEPFDAYGTEWSWGVGRQSVVGRLFGLREGEEAGTFWEFRLIWDPGSGRVLAHQYGAQGIVGTGPMESAGPGRTRMDQTFTTPDGTSFRTGHDAREIDADTQQTESFDILEDGTWKPRRTYVWKRATHIPPSDVGLALPHRFMRWARYLPRRKAPVWGLGPALCPGSTSRLRPSVFFGSSDCNGGASTATDGSSGSTGIGARRRPHATGGRHA